jgi:transporter family-2 protein
LILLALPGIPWWFALTGLLAGPYLLAAAFLAPRVGVGPFMAAIVTGQLLAGVALDHVGAFGATPRPIDAMRMLGVAALLAGLLLIRGRR